MYDAILLPTDGSAGMASAIRHCLHQARTHDATVHVLYVVDIRAYIMLPEETQGRVRGLLATEGERALAALEQHAEEDALELVTAIGEGVPHEAILQYVDDQEIDMIVMGTHGRSGERKRVVGSVAEEVVRSADVPVMTVRMREADLAAVGDAIPDEGDSEIPDEQRRYIS